MGAIFRAIIVDDERLARRELRSMLDAYSEIEIAGEADSVGKALELIWKVKPDVVFLDIQMPGETGFELLEKVDVAFKTIFVTAFDAHAIRAFEVNALDYLLKPINPERLARAIHRLNAQGEATSSSSSSPARKLEYEDRLFIEAGERSVFLKLSQIKCICGAGDYTEVYTADGKRTLVLKPLKEWEERLPEKYFSRIHRSTIINLEFVEKMENWFNRSYRIYLRQTSEPFVMSRRYAARLKLRFG
jgi:two-component system, LytTR family, response regulator